jgi:PAS domain S-box-containing protein
MRRLRDYPISLKFFGLMSLLLLALLLAAGLLTYQRQKQLIVRFAIDNARTFASQLIQTREYMSSVVKGEPEQNYNLVPQVVATQVAKRVTHGTKFYVRQVSLRYRNPENRPDMYEGAQLEKFKSIPPVTEIYDVVNTKGGVVFRYMQPMLATSSCLICHGAFEQAPEFVRKRFPQGHYSYNYRVGDVIGAVSVSIPLKDLYAQLGADFKADLLSRALIFLVVIIAMGLLMGRAIVQPVKMLSQSIIRVTRTGNFDERLPQRTHDEIGNLIGAFNEMMEELSRRTLQTRESDERYRKFIELAASAVITFMQDGKIVIANQKAEALFGLPRQSLLGESIFGFIEDGSALREQLAAAPDMSEETSIQRVHRASGKVTEVEMVISASRTDREPMFTAILRDRSEG